jgi:hypothetical protein
MATSALQGQVFAMTLQGQVAPPVNSSRTRLAAGAL